jgi:hypothetical protein
MTDFQKEKGSESSSIWQLPLPWVHDFFISEEPLFYVLEKKGSKEIRDYKSYHVAYTEIVGGSYENAMTLGFWKLSDYFTFKNSGERSVDGSLEESAAGSRRSTKMHLTAPVFESCSNSIWKISMMIPSKFALETVPLPLDSTIHFEEVPECTVAAININGLVNADKIRQATADLLFWIRGHGKYFVSSESYRTHHNLFPTFQFLRRTEIHFKIGLNHNHRSS